MSALEIQNALADTLLELVIQQQRQQQAQKINVQDAALSSSKMLQNKAA